MQSKDTNAEQMLIVLPTLFVFVLRFNVPVNNFSVMSGRLYVMYKLKYIIGSIAVLVSADHFV